MMDMCTLVQVHNRASVDLSPCGARRGWDPLGLIDSRLFHDHGPNRQQQQRHSAARREFADLLFELNFIGSVANYKRE